eukprot:1161968-Pelagomonas_calceolata.AAC.3
MHRVHGRKAHGPENSDHPFNSRGCQLLRPHTSHHTQRRLAHPVWIRLPQHHIDGLLCDCVGRQGAHSHDLIHAHVAHRHHHALVNGQLVQGEGAGFVRAQHIHACTEVLRLCLLRGARAWQCAALGVIRDDVFASAALVSCIGQSASLRYQHSLHQISCPARQGGLVLPIEVIRELLHALAHGLCCPWRTSGSCFLHLHTACVAPRGHQGAASCACTRPVLP